MKKHFVLIALAAVMVLSLAACGGSTEETQAPTTADYTESRTALQEYIDNHASTDCLGSLADGSDITVLVTEKGATVKARVVLPQNIPCVADELCTLLTAASAELDIEIALLTVNSYSKNNAGEISNMVDWHTYDLQTGIFTHEVDSVVSGGYTVDKLYEYFKLKPGEFIG